MYYYEEIFYRDLLEAKFRYIQTRQYWLRDSLQSTLDGWKECLIELRNL